MTGWLTTPVSELFGAEATAQEAYDLLTVDVPAASWIAALETARTTLGCTYFDWLSAVDEPGTGFRVSAHVVALGPVRRLLVRTTVPHDTPVLASAVEVYAGAGWHERETHEMFGIAFEGHPHLVPLLLPEGFEGHPLRKDFVLAARVVKAWPGAKEPGESGHGGPRRRQMLPPGVPDPNEWGPHKGTLPAAPARPARGARTGAGPGPAGERTARGGPSAGDERPARRMRTAGEGSASQSAPPAGSSASAESPASGTESGPDTASGTRQAPAQGRPAGTGGAGPRRARNASEGSASQRGAAAPRTGTSASDVPGDTAPQGAAGTADTAAGGAHRADDELGSPQGVASDGVPQEVVSSDAPRDDVLSGAPQGDVSNSASQDAAAPDETQTPSGGVTESDAPAPKRGTRSADAPWHHARPAFDERRTDRAGTGDPPAARGDVSDGATDDAPATAAPDRSSEDAPSDEVSGETAPEESTPDEDTPPGGLR